MGKQAALSKARRKKHSGSAALPRRTADLAAQADAILCAPESFWRLLPATDAQAKISDALIEMRRAEVAFLAGIALRLNILVRRNELDGSIWDFIEAARTRLRTAVSQGMPEDWESLGLANGRVPADAEGRSRSVQLLAQYLRVHRDVEDMAGRFTLREAEKLLSATRALAIDGEALRSELRAAADLRRRSVARLQEELAVVRAALWTTLSRHDARFLMGCGVCGRLQTAAELVSEPAPSRRIETSSRGDRGVLRRAVLGKAAKPIAAPMQNLSIFSAVTMLMPTGR